MVSIPGQTYECCVLLFEMIDPRIASDNVVPLNDCGRSLIHGISMQLQRCDPTAMASFTTADVFKQPCEVVLHHIHITQRGH